MDFIWDSITDWLKEVLVSGIVSNLSGMFDSTNQQVGEIAGQVGLTPQAWNSGVFTMIQNLSNNVMIFLTASVTLLMLYSLHQTARNIPMPIFAEATAYMKRFVQLRMLLLAI